MIGVHMHSQVFSQEGISDDGADDRCKVTEHNESVEDGNGQVVFPSEYACEVNDEDSSHSIIREPLTHLVDKDEPDARRKTADRFLGK